LRGAGPESIAPILSIEPALYVDAASGECGPLELPCSLALLRQLWTQPPIAPEQVDSANEEIARDVGAAKLPRLRTIAAERQSISRPTARLVLAAGPEAMLEFVYNGVPVDSRRLSSEGEVVRQMAGDSLYEIPRDRDTESRLRARLRCALERSAPRMQLFNELDRSAWLAFMLHEVPALKAEGWDVVADTGFPYCIAEPEDWHAALNRDTTDREWFDLRLGVLVEGNFVDLLPALSHFLQAEAGMELGERVPEGASYCLVGEHLMLQLEDGRYVALSTERVQRIAHTLVELFDRDGLNSRKALSLPVSHAARLAQLANGPDALALKSEDASLLEVVEDVAAGASVAAVQATAGFRGTLRHYQQEGLGWLQFLRRHRAGGILADDMGLGKTVQTLAHLMLEKEHGRLRKPSLIVAPVSVIGNWSQEVRRFAPDLTLLTLHGARRKETYGNIGYSDIVITSYALLQLDSEVLLAHRFYYVILDEAQTIKNPRAKVSQFARQLHAEHRLCLTGTPMENHLGELWSLFEFLRPGFLGDERHFDRHYRTPIEKKADRKRSQALVQRIAPFVLRRTKDVVAPELPPKTQIVESIVLDERQRDMYDSIRLTMHRRVREIIQQQGLARSHITVLDALLKLRQACCDPKLVRDDAETRSIPSAKLEWLQTVLPELVAEGRRILLFSQFTSMLEIIEQAVVALDIRYCMLTGETQNRAAVVERFQKGEAPLFLISLKAGGTGLNLTAADTVIHYDPWWNPAAEAQATDRAYRIGQDKPVFVYKLIAQGTVEEKILRLQEDKHALASQLYEAQGMMPAQLGAEDVEALFT
jgi:superfamily II DNA or RNA helicase